jgi:hypothetical protein
VLNCLTSETRVSPAYFLVLRLQHFENKELIRFAPDPGQAGPKLATVFGQTTCPRKEDAMRTKRKISHWALCAGVALSGLVAGPILAQARCLTVEVARPVVFPDGAEHAGGRLDLCDWKAFTPVSHLHRSYVNGRPIQLLMGRETTNERAAEAPNEVFFRVDVTGRLELVGYARTLRGRSVTVRFHGKDSQRNVNRPARAIQNDDLLIVMARPH